MSFPLKNLSFSIQSASFFSRCSGQARSFVGVGEQARGGKGNGVIVNDYFDFSGKGVEVDRVDDGVGIIFFVNCYM